jgi:hypothetical protein
MASFRKPALVGLLALCGLSVGTTSSAVAAPRLHLLARTSTPVVTDRERFALYQPLAGPTVLLDTRSGHRRNVRFDSPCAAPDAWRGRFLIECQTWATVFLPFILDARSGSMTEVPGSGRSFSPSEDYFGRIGRRWLAGSAAIGPVVAVYLNWHTGQLRSFGESFGTEVPRDLDSPGLRPLTGASRFGVYLRDRGFTVTQGPQPRAPLKLRHHSGRARTLDRCDRPCESISVGGGWVSWSTWYEVHALRLATGKKLTWRFAAGPSSVQHTANAIFFDAPIYSGSNFVAYRVLEAPLPSR